MDQILANLADSVAGDLADVGGEEAELPGEISEVMQALGCVPGDAIKPEPVLSVVNIDQRLDKCAERQTYLESRYRNLQMRINRLRAQKLSCNARDVLCSVVTSCDKRRARMNGELPPEQVVKMEREGAGGEARLVEVVKEEAEVPGKKIRFKKYNKARTDEVLGQVHSQLRHVQSFLDPDATESSSGGESADEMDRGFSASAELYAPLQERAKYRWYARRAQLASQWVWLQAQVSDLEYKIRQSTDQYRGQRVAKGSVQLGEEVVSWPAHAKQPVLPGPGDSGVPLSCPVPTKVYGASSPAPAAAEDASTDDEASMTCCRVRPVKRVRRRKLVDTHALHHTVARAAKLSTVSCQCLRPGQWCVLCLGRRSHTLTVTSSGAGAGARHENVSLLDHSYHTVLSGRGGQDTRLGLVLMESLAARRWLVRHTAGTGPLQPGQPAHLSRLLNINDKDRKEKKFKEKLDLNLKRKYIKRKDKDGKIIKKRRKLDSERDSRPESPVEELGGPVVAVRDGVERIRDKGELKKKRKSSYDIDHIVIPMSMAATTRVEKIKYKEILVPSWREVNKEAGEKVKEEVQEAELVPPPVKEDVKEEVKEEVKMESTETKDDAGEDEEDDFEDISDLAYKLRHVKAEEEERIRYTTPVGGRVHGGQSGGQRGHRGRVRRLDSCRTEASSGANTPNPLSPRSEDIEDIVVATRPSSPSGLDTGDSAVTSPPPVPDTPPSASVMSSPPAGLMPTPLSSVPASVRGRRRTSSQTKSRDRNLSEASQHSQESSRWGHQHILSLCNAVVTYFMLPGPRAPGLRWRRGSLSPGY